MSAPPYPLHPEPMKKSWIERNPLWKIPLGCLILILLITVFGGVVMTIVTSSFRNSDVYKQALVMAEANPQVRERIGEPMNPGWLISGQLNVTGSTGNANLAIPVSGPRGSGRVRAVASKSGGDWHFTCLQVDVSGQPEAIDLLSVQPSAERDF
jgi:hypothetical protein